GRCKRSRPGQLSQHGRLDRPKLCWANPRTHREGAASDEHFPGLLRAEDDGEALACGAPYYLVHGIDGTSTSNRSNRSTAKLCSRRLNACPGVPEFLLGVIAATQSRNRR